MWEFKPDCILTDPPYGIDVVGSDGRIGLAKHFGDVGGDTAPFKANHILDYDLPSIIWGANHFSSQLPDFPRMLVWNKRGEGNKPNDFADAEIAWCSEKGVIRTFDHVWRGAARASEREVARMHPTQKPILVFEWCLEFFPNYHMPLDMYCGSGTIFLSQRTWVKVQLVSNTMLVTSPLAWKDIIIIYKGLENRREFYENNRTRILKNILVLETIRILV